MKLPRRRFLHLVAGAAALPLAPHVASAQAYPSRPVSLIVFVPAGGTPDIIARLVGQAMSRQLGQPVVIDKPAHEACARVMSTLYACPAHHAAHLG